ncbi:uncharacterized protein P7C70_g7439, partial [Phenoliferia sp. Uapishka_3]
MPSLFAITVPVLIRNLKTLSEILNKAIEFAPTAEAQQKLLTTRLVEDMYALPYQVQRVSDVAKGVAVRIGGVEPVPMEDNEVTFEDLKKRIEKTIAVLEKVNETHFEGKDHQEIIIKSKNGDRHFDATGLTVRRSSHPNSLPSTFIFSFIFCSLSPPAPLRSMWPFSGKSKKAAEPEVKSDSFSEPRYAPTGLLNFPSANLPEYSDCFAIILDDLFTRAELSRFLATAEASTPWDVARVNATADIAYVDTSYRNGERIILDSEELSREIFERVRPHLAKIEEFEEERWSQAAGGKKVVKKRMVRMNERLRFLRYPPGGFFARHCDGTYVTPDGKQRTYYTLQLYLPSSADESEESFKTAEGGSTRFHPPSRMAMGRYCDVEPVPGRVLVFQHARLVHTGEEVLSGIKCTMRSDILYEDAE